MKGSVSINKLISLHEFAVSRTLRNPWLLEGEKFNPQLNREILPGLPVLTNKLGEQR